MKHNVNINKVIFNKMITILLTIFEIKLNDFSK